LFEAFEEGLHAYKPQLIESGSMLLFTIRVLYRTLNTVIITIVAWKLPYFSLIGGLIGALSFWPLAGARESPYRIYMKPQGINDHDDMLVMIWFLSHWGVFSDLPHDDAQASPSTDPQDVFVDELHLGVYACGVHFSNNGIVICVLTGLELSTWLWGGYL